MALAQSGSSTSEEEEEVDEEELDLEAKLEVASKEIIRRGRTIRRLEAHIKQVEAKSEEVESQNDEIRAEHIDLKRRFEEHIKICKDLTVELGSRASKIEEMEKELLRLQQQLKSSKENLQKLEMIGETSSGKGEKNVERVQQSEAALAKENENVPQKLKEKVVTQKKIAKNKEDLKKQPRVANKNEEKKVW